MKKRGKFVLATLTLVSIGWMMMTPTMAALPPGPNSDFIYSCPVNLPSGCYYCPTYVCNSEQ